MKRYSHLSYESSPYFLRGKALMIILAVMIPVAAIGGYLASRITAPESTQETAQQQPVIDSAALPSESELATWQQPSQAQPQHPEDAPPSQVGQQPSVAVSAERLAAKLKANPDDAQGWLLLARSYEFLQRYDESYKAFQRAIDLGVDDPDVLKSQQDVLARSKGQTAMAETTAPQAASSAGAAAVSVHVSLSSALAGKASPGDTVYVFARAPDGPPMPLAVVRKTVADLPVDVVLDDSMAMMPSRTISSFGQVIVQARVSKSGNALPQPGDLVSPAATVATASGDTLKLTIDHSRQ
jgi:hypothetical protein